MYPRAVRARFIETYVALIIAAYGTFHAQSAAANDDWAKHYIGAYSLNRDGEELEIALWPQRSAVKDLHIYPKLAFNGIIRTADNACLFRFQANFRFPRYFTFSSATDPIIKAKTEAYGLYSGNFYDLKNLQREQELACEKRIGGKFYLVQETLGEQIVFGGRGKRGVPSDLRPIDRVEVSPSLLALIQRNQTEAIAKHGYELAWPDEDDYRALADPSVTARMEGALSDRCMQRVIHTHYELYTRGIDKVAARLVDDNRVLITEFRVPETRLAKGEKQATDSWLYERSRGVAWSDILHVTAERASAQAHCASASATLQYLAAKEAGELSILDMPEGMSDESLDILDAYVLTPTGLSHITPQKAGAATSVVNLADAFEEGDLVYYLRDSPGFRLGVRAWLKNPFTGKSQLDYAAPLEHVALSRNARLSEKYQAEILSGQLDIFNAPICMTYAGVKKPAECVQSLPAAQRNAQFIVAKTTRENAMAIFRDLYPNFVAPQPPPCPTLPFCDAKTAYQSDYLNAVYLQQFKAVKDYDKAIMSSSSHALNSAFAPFLEDDEEIHVSIIPYLLDEYVYAYQDRPSHCFGPGSRSMTFEDYVPETSLVDGFGTKVWSAGGYARKTVYTMVDAKFVEVCNEVCGIREAAVLRELINNFFNGTQAGNINRRMQRFIAQEDCHSPKLKRFEDGLLAVYQHLTVPAEQTNRFHRGYY